MKQQNQTPSQTQQAINRHQNDDHSNAPSNSEEIERIVALLQTSIPDILQGVEIETVTGTLTIDELSDLVPLKECIEYTYKRKLAELTGKPMSASYKQEVMDALEGALETVRDAIQGQSKATIDTSTQMANGDDMPLAYVSTKDLLKHLVGDNDWHKILPTDAATKQNVVTLMAAILPTFLADDREVERYGNGEKYAYYKDDLAVARAFEIAVNAVAKVECAVYDRKRQLLEDNHADLMAKERAEGV